MRSTSRTTSSRSSTRRSRTSPTKLAANDTSVEEADRLRLEIYRDELLARVAEAKKGETFAIAALRFFTGVQTAFDIPDEPLEASRQHRSAPSFGISPRRASSAPTSTSRAPALPRAVRRSTSRARSSTRTSAWASASRTRLRRAPRRRTRRGSATRSTASAPPSPSASSGASISCPKNARINAAESQLEEARALERYALGGVAVEVENAYATAVEAKAREENWDRAEHRAKRWISSVQDAVDLGTKDERYIVEPLRAYVFARANHVQALMDFNVALSELARVTGWEAAAPPG